MAKLKTVIVKTEKRSDNKFNIKIRVTHNRMVRYVATEEYVLEQFWDEAGGIILPGGGNSAYDADKANGRVQMLLGDMARKKETIRNLRFLDMSSFIMILRDKHRDRDFFSEIDGRISSLTEAGNTNYAGSFRTTKNLIKEFYPSPILPFETIDYSFLTRLDHFFRKKGMNDTSIGFYMRNVRTLMSLQRKQGFIPITHNPFGVYKIPKGEARENMVLTPREMATIAKIDIKEPLMRWSRDMFILCFCLIGINPKDLFFTGKLVGGRIFYRRSKGKKRYSVKVPPQALHIIYRYPGKKYMLDAMDKYADYTSATKRIDKKLESITALCKIDKKVTIYTSRHSWSAYARFLGISKDDIAGALGHKQIELPKVTEFYDHIEEEQRRVDLANQKVIRLILKTVPKEDVIAPRAG